MGVAAQVILERASPVKINWTRRKPSWSGQGGSRTHMILRSVVGEGVEPSRSCLHTFLRRNCLPVPAPDQKLTYVNSLRLSMRGGPVPSPGHNYLTVIAFSFRFAQTFLAFDAKKESYASASSATCPQFRYSGLLTSNLSLIIISFVSLT